MITQAGSGHPGGSLSCVEILVGLYFYKMKYRPQEPQWPERDRFILSKGHACPALYATLAHAGYFPREELNTLRKFGSRLQGHPDMLKGLPGLEVSTGSLGQGLSVACGIALSVRLDKKPSRVYCLIGDGETHEGQIWEAAMTAAHYKLSNLCVVLDANGFCIDGQICNVKSIEPVADKWKAFGWNVLMADGHAVEQVGDTYDAAERCHDKPTLIVARTIKGKGISFMENENNWHGVAPTGEQLKKALEELGK